MLILLPPSEKKAAYPAPAIELYTGVLYAALAWERLTSAQKARASKAVAIISAKYGAIGPLEPIEPYKLKIDIALMRPKVAPVLNQIDCSLIIDCRSSTYQTVWHSPVEKTVEIKVFTMVDGVKKIITHMSKKTRGEVARLLLARDSYPTTPQEVHDVVSQQFKCELKKSDDTKPWVLEVYA